MSRQYALVNPESKLWIGWFRSWVHAFAHLRKMPAGWFIVRRTRYHKPPGWLKLDEPCELRMTTANGVYGPGPRTRTQPPPGARWTKRRYHRVQ